MGLRHSFPDKSDASTLAKHVSLAEAKNKNFVISPLSLHVVLCLIAAGSSGSTRKQVLSFFNSFKSSNDLNKHFSEIVSHIFVDIDITGRPKLGFANGVWVDQTLPLKPTFKKVVNDAFKAVSKQVDFINKADEVSSKVNSWVEKQTNGLVKELLPPGSIRNTTRLIFADGIYFKGAWDLKFEPSLTKEDEFRLLNGSSVKVPFMTSFEQQFIGQFDGFDVLRLPYKQGEDHNRQFSMYVFLPNKKDGLPSLITKVGSLSDFLKKHLPFRKVNVEQFRLPRFKFSFGFEASKVLKVLGIKLPFMGGLTEMTDSHQAHNLFVSSIFHKSFIEVSEEGTEASAASSFSVTFKSTDKLSSDFVADHPFLFLIREEMTGVVLFIGYVMNPLES